MNLNNDKENFVCERGQAMVMPKSSWLAGRKFI